MENIHIILNNSIPSLDVENPSLRLRIPSRKPKKPAATDHRHLPHRRHHGVPPQHTQRAPVILPFHKYKIKRHKQAHLRLRGRPINTLGPAHHLGRRLRPNSQRVVHHGRHSKPRGGSVAGLGLGYRDHGRVGPADNVVEVEVEVTELLLLETECGRGEHARESAAGFGFRNGGREGGGKEEEEEKVRIIGHFGFLGFGE
ncbi:hypothetical protein LINGRAHAP2_LOCUS12873, partial [Linum grandiflorum]